MECPFCSHPKAYKHGKTSIGSQRYRCPNCQQTYTDTSDTVYYRRQVNEQTVRVVLQSHAEGSNLRGVSRISGLAYNTGLLHYPSREPESTDDTQCPGASHQN